MPVLVAALLGGLLQIAASMVGRGLLALGLAFLSYNGIATAIDALKALVIANFENLPSSILPLLAVFKIDVCISMFFSAIAARLVLQGLTSGAIKRLVSR